MPLDRDPYEYEPPGPQFPPPGVPPTVPPPGGPPAGLPGEPPPIVPGGGEEYAPGGGGGGGGGGVFSLPAYPRINIPGAPVFTPRVFAAPSMKDAYKEPGYQFRLRSGSEAMERSAAARGVLRSGGTLQNLLEYGQNFAAAEYQQVFNRALAAHQANYRGDYDAFAPKLAHWQIRAGAERDAQMAQYQAQLQNALQQAAPRGGGGGYDFDPEIFLPELPPPPMAPGGGGGGGGGMYPYPPYTPEYF